ncbi:creatininase family protein [Microbacterium sp. No. 7]|uniref:creatininase family protein n=1 Tax=Microbacterium sp. No. 7 TaxID=1714373 RepID=UPI0006D21B4C|nr:creatininase family protein [Microbacterium sp. No. 7]ALJ22183.1 creatinine amidohydrolase [Microbacterium sp. No. 7]
MRRLDHLSGPEAGRVLDASSILVLPTGAIEHHGEHLPLATDAIMAERIAARIVDAAAADGHDVWLLPTLAYTKSDEHAWAPGTMTLSSATFLATLVDLGRSIARTPARTVLFYNGHGGNVAPLGVALRELRRRFGLRTFAEGIRVPVGDGAEGPDERGFGIHGGHGETSLMLHLAPELVSLSRGVRAVPDALAAFSRIGFAGAPVQFGWLSDDFGTGGVLGDPTAATAAEGERLAAELVEAGRASIAEIARWPIGPREGDDW